MLAELQQLSNSLSAIGIHPPEVHKSVKPIARGPFVIANLDESGCVREVELRASSDDSQIFKIQKDNQNGFPIFKLAYPLFRVPPDHVIRDKWKSKAPTNAERSQTLKAACDEAELSDGFEKSKKRLSQLRKFAIEELKPQFEPLLPENPAIARLFRAFAAEPFSPEQILRAIAEAIPVAVERGEDAGVAEKVLMGRVKKSGGVESGDMPVFLDAWRAPNDSFIRVAHPKTTDVYNRALRSEVSGDADGICGLSGNHQELENGNLPSPRLPALADTILFSVFDEIPCLERYGRIGSDAFPIGKRTAERLNNAALWITQDERKGKTWSAVPRNDDAKSDLVIAYIDADPELDARLSEMMCGPEQRESAFGDTAASVLKALEMWEVRKKKAVLHTLALRRISKGQVQVELSRDYLVERIFNALAEWQAAAVNAPEVSIYVPLGKGKPAHLIRPRTPFPADMMRATKSVWIRSGAERQETTGCTLATIYDLFLGEGVLARTAAQTLLSTILARCTPLLLLTGDQLSRHGRSVLDLPAAVRPDAVAAVTILGIVLYKLNRRKELYMNETAFLLGRMLGLSDLLHAQYCRVVRDGNLPPQLLGNQHYSMAADRPARAFAVLGERLKIYRAWADTARVEKQNTPDLQRAVKTAKWVLRQMSEVAPAVRGNWPERLDDRDKAEMLLGYLSRGDKETKEGEEESE